MKAFSILQALKVELKKSKVSYRDLAKELKISEAGVKKMLTREDISLERALAICKVINISFADIASQVEGAQQPQLRFTDKQVAYFAKHICYFHFYMKLAYEQKTPLEIQTEHNLSYRSLNVYLKKLEELGLIKRHPKDRAQIMGGIPLAVSTSGTALESVKYDITKHLIERIRNTQTGFLAGAGLLLTKEETDEVAGKITELLNSYSLISTRNRSREAKAGKAVYAPLSLMVIQSPTSMFTEIIEL